MKRILHIVPAPFRSDGVVGGAERYAMELARNMADAAPTRLLTFGQRDSMEKIGNLEMRVVGSPHYVRGQRGNPFSAAILSEVLAADVVHCHQQHIVASSVSAALARATGRKVFVSDLGGGGWDISGYVSTDRWYHGHLHISEYSRKYFGHSSSPQAHVILGGVDVERFSPAPASQRTKDVLFVGRLLPHKGVNYLIDGLPNDMKLNIAGRPYHEEYFKYLCSRADGKQVQFHHNWDDDLLIEAYRTSLAIVLPSVFMDVYGNKSGVPELLGQTLLEGMACGIPAICANVASMPEIVIDGVTGFIVPPNDPAAIHSKLSWLRDHPEDARRMGQAARERVLKVFTWPAVVKRCLEAYALPKA